MIRTKEKQVIDAMQGTEAIIYFSITERFETKDTVSFTVEMYVMNGDQMQVIRRQPVHYRKSTFVALFGETKYNDFESNIDNLLISQIHYVNNVHDWTGSELSRIKYWNLTSSDLEVFEQA